MGCHHGRINLCTYVRVSRITNSLVKDNHEEATIGAFLFCELVQMLADSPDLDDEIDELLQAFEAKSGRPVLHTVVFY